MEGIWDLRADAVQEGDKLRDVSPIARKTITDDNGYTHYRFSQQLFKTSSYIIPDDDYELFKIFLEGEALIYPSDGDIPSGIVASEALKVLNYIVACSKDFSSFYYDAANTALKNGKNSLVRGAIKLFLGIYTTNEWRRKRFTASINFFTFQVSLLDHALIQMEWVKNKETNQWEKILQWFDAKTSQTSHESICMANNLNHLLDFVNENYFEGTNLKEIFIKKLKRGFDVDINDLINVALYNSKLNKNHKEEWNNAWESFEAATNTRNSRITSNLISLCRYSLGIADHLERIGNALDKYHGKILDRNEFPDEELERICRTSIDWEKFLEENGPEPTRIMLHEFILKQKDDKPLNVRNLRLFAGNVLKLLNSKYEYLKMIFEVE